MNISKTTHLHNIRLNLVLTRVLQAWLQFFPKIIWKQKGTNEKLKMASKKGREASREVWRRRFESLKAYF
jgi:hypothetical protein